LDDLEIPITIYTPIDVKREKIVVFFHGGGKRMAVFC
jgi:dipeptidyl aminopeptidase/acylaminoacyl peptidase